MAISNKQIVKCSNRPICHRDVLHTHASFVDTQSHSTIRYVFNKAIHIVRYYIQPYMYVGYMSKYELYSVRRFVFDLIVSRMYVL